MAKTLPEPAYRFAYHGNPSGTSSCLRPLAGMTDPVTALAIYGGKVLPEILSVQEAAAYLHCHPEKVKRMLRNGELPGIKFGHSWLVPAKQLSEALLTKLENKCHPRREKDNL